MFSVCSVAYFAFLRMHQMSWSNIFWKPDKGPEGKSDCAASIGGKLLSKASRFTCRKAQRGREKTTSMKWPNTPATAKKGYVPHDCKQSDFPSGTLESLDIWNIPAFWPSTNSEMIQFFLVIGHWVYWGFGICHWEFMIPSPVWFRLCRIRLVRWKWKRILGSPTHPIFFQWRAYG